MESRRIDHKVKRDTSYAVLGAEHGGTDLYSKVVKSLAGDKEQTFKRLIVHTTEAAPEQD